MFWRAFVAACLLITDLGEGRAQFGPTLFGQPGFASYATSCPATALSSGTICSTVDLNFSAGTYWGGSLSSMVSVVRASQGTDLLPSSASGASYSTFANNIARITSGSGLLIEDTRTNQLVNSATPTTQTTGSLGTGTYTLWVNGSGSATMLPGTGTGCGTGTATNGTPVNFTISGAGTCVVTVSGSLNAFQLELGSWGTSFIVTAGAAGTRQWDHITGAGALLSVYGASGFSIVSQTNSPVRNSQQQAVWSYNDGSPSNRVDFRSTGFSFITVAGAGQSAISVTALTANATHKVGLSAQTGGTSLVEDNGAVQTGTPAALPTVSNMDLGNPDGNNASGQLLDGYMARLTGWNVRLSDSALKALTQ